MIYGNYGFVKSAIHIRGKYWLLACIALDLFTQYSRGIAILGPVQWKSVHESIAGGSLLRHEKPRC